VSDDLLLNPKYWRDRAEEARAMAAMMQDKQAQEHLHAVARSYDRLAEVAAERVKRERERAKPKSK
jgi:hypothetical protein